MKMNRKKPTYSSKYHQRIFTKFDSEAILVQPGLKILTGRTNDAIWLSQVLYWLDKGELKDKLTVIKSRREMEHEIQLTRDQQIRTEKRLKKLGVVDVFTAPGRPSPINHIQVNMASLERAIHRMQNTDDNIRETRTLSSVEHEHRRTANTENISETIENIKDTGAGYKFFLEQGKNLPNRK